VSKGVGAKSQKRSTRGPAELSVTRDFLKMCTIAPTLPGVGFRAKAECSGVSSSPRHQPVDFVRVTESPGSNEEAQPPEVQSPNEDVAEERGLGPRESVELHDRWGFLRAPESTR